MTVTVFCKRECGVLKFENISDMQFENEGDMCFLCMYDKIGRMLAGVDIKMIQAFTSGE